MCDSSSLLSPDETPAKRDGVYQHLAKLSDGNLLGALGTDRRPGPLKEVATVGFQIHSVESNRVSDTRHAATPSCTQCTKNNLQLVS